MTMKSAIFVCTRSACQIEYDLWWTYFQHTYGGNIRYNRRSVFFFSSTSSEVRDSTISSRLLAYFSIFWIMLSMILNFLNVQTLRSNLPISWKVNKNNLNIGGSLCSARIWQKTCYLPLLICLSFFRTALISGLSWGSSAQHCSVSSRMDGFASLSISFGRSGRYGFPEGDITFSITSVQREIFR